MEYVTNWQGVSASRYSQAQKKECQYWSQQDPDTLTLTAQYYYYAGYYEWTRYRGLLNPFCVSPDRPDNFQIPGDEIADRNILDLGCGPMSHTFSLVHCSRVHVLDPLIPFYRHIQPFGWEFFASLSSAAGEQLPYDPGSFDFVHCWNVLDHTRDADRILDEIARVLAPEGQLLLACDVRSRKGGGAAHPYKWSIDAFESGIFARFTPITEVAFWDHESKKSIPRAQAETRMTRWMCRLRKKPRA